MRIQVWGKKKSGRFGNFVSCLSSYWKRTTDLETFFLGVKPKKRAILRIAVLEALM